jgi:hypothetical protein
VYQATSHAYFVGGTEGRGRDKAARALRADSHHSVTASILVQP